MRFIASILFLILISGYSTGKQVEKEDSIPIGLIKIESNFNARKLTARNFHTELVDCLPALWLSPAALVEMKENLNTDDVIHTLSNKKRSNQFIFQRSTGICLQYSANRFPIFAAEELFNTANPSGIPYHIEINWYKEIALHITINGKATVGYINKNGTAFIVSYWVNQINSYPLYYKSEFKKTGEWEHSNLDLRFSHPFFNGVSVVKRGSSLQSVKQFPLDGAR